jgi:hypothetical protein
MNRETFTSSIPFLQQGRNHRETFGNLHTLFTAGYKGLFGWRPQLALPRASPPRNIDFMWRTIRPPQAVERATGA